MNAPNGKPLRISLVGAESSGKTTLSVDMAAALTQRGLSVQVVPEVLREWCEKAQRTPRQDEQLSIATEHMRRVEAASATPGLDVVISDTAPLMIAVYSDMLFDDTSLYDMALAYQRKFDITLVMGLDIPWVADGLQRDGPHVRAPIDAKVRAALASGGVDYRVVYGEGPARLQNALRTLDTALGVTPSSGNDSAKWVWVCDKCSDPDCEHRLFSGLAAKAS